VQAFCLHPFYASNPATAPRVAGDSSTTGARLAGVAAATTSSKKDAIARSFLRGVLVDQRSTGEAWPMRAISSFVVTPGMRAVSVAAWWRRSWGRSPSGALRRPRRPRCLGKPLTGPRHVWTFRILHRQSADALSGRKLS